MLLGHGAQGAHAAVGLVGAPLKQFDFAGGLLRAGEQAAYHHRPGASRQGLGGVARIADAAIGDEGGVGLLKGLGHIGDGRHLRHPDAGDDAGGAYRAGADAHFDGVRPGLHQSLSTGRCRHIPPYHIAIGVRLLDGLDHLQHPGGMAVGGVHD